MSTTTGFDDSPDPLQQAHAEAQAARDAGLRAQLLQRQESDDYLWLMNDPRGRRVVWRMLDEAGVYRSSFNTCPATMAFMEGQRNAGLRLLGRLMAHCPTNLHQLMTEENRARSDEQPTAD